LKQKFIQNTLESNPNNPSEEAADNEQPKQKRKSYPSSKMELNHSHTEQSKILWGMNR